MERVYTDYTANGRQVVLNNVPASFSAFTIENLRLIFNETQKNAKGKAIDPLVSTGVKENVSSITYNGTAHTVTIILTDNVPEIVSTDDLTIKIDMGDSVDSISVTIDNIDTSVLALEETTAKQGDNPAATNTAILDNLEDIATDAEIYAMFPGAVDEQGNISVDANIDEEGYLNAEFEIDNNGILTFN